MGAAPINAALPQLSRVNSNVQSAGPKIIETRGSLVDAMPDGPSKQFASVINEKLGGLNQQQLGMVNQIFNDISGGQDGGEGGSRPISTGIVSKVSQMVKSGATVDTIVDTLGKIYGGI